MNAPPRPNLRDTLPDLITPAQAARIIGVLPKNLWRYDEQLQPVRTPGGTRRYVRDRVLAAQAEAQERFGL